MNDAGPSIESIKAALRLELRTRLAAMSLAERAEESARIRERLAQDPAWLQADSILGFVPTPSEPDLWPGIRAALAAGRRLCLPRFDPVTNCYRPCQVRDLEADLAPGPYGIPEPRPGCADWDGKSLDLILVPGLGFSALGGRLGRGKGYYDRLLVGWTGCKYGVAFEGQMISELPMEPHDVRLDRVITPSRSFRCLPAPSSPSPSSESGRGCGPL